MRYRDSFKNECNERKQIQDMKKGIPRCINRARNRYVFIGNWEKGD